jgi:hypothetical protein
MKIFFENLVQRNTHDVGIIPIDGSEQFYAHPICGLPGISNVFDKMDMNAQQLIAAAEQQLHRSQFQVKSEFITFFSPRQLSNSENAFVVTNFD